MPGPMSDCSDRSWAAGSVSELVQGGSVLHMAVAQHDLQMVRSMLGRGAQQSCRNEEGLTPLQLQLRTASLLVTLTSLVSLCSLYRSVHLVCRSESFMQSIRSEALPVVAYAHRVTAAAVL